MVKQRAFIFCVLIAFASVAAAAQDYSHVKVPEEVRPFVETGMIANAVESGDLNGDGKKDYVLVMSKPAKTDAAFDDGEDDQRTTLILIRDRATGKLSVAGSNDEAAYCRTCGGVLGDPFAGVAIKGTSFTVSNYGGSSWRWSEDFTFSYSPRDKQWQLTRVKETTFNVFEPKKVKTSIYTPPRSFGLINFADFDPDSYKGKGKK